MNFGCVFIGLIDKIYWFCMSNFTANFQGLELHSSPARLQKLLNLEKLSHYLRMQNQKLKEFRVCTNIPMYLVQIYWKKTRGYDLLKKNNIVKTAKAVPTCICCRLNLISGQNDLT